MGVEFASGKKEFQDADVIPNLQNMLGLKVDLLNLVRYVSIRRAMHGGSSSSAFF
jgi:predicted nucleotidyltransferase